jgi:CheY-like chemotaxis protein
MVEREITVLVVDDNPDFLEQMKLELESTGITVVAAESAGAAAALVSGTRFDAAVCDLMMEHADSGFTLAHQIKRKDPAIPVILVTGVAGETGIPFDAASREEHSWLAADAVLDKPVRGEQLRRELARLLKVRL